MFPQGVFFRGLESIAFILLPGPLRSLLSGEHRGRMVLLKDLPQMEKHMCLSHKDLEHRCGIPDFPYQPQAAGETSVCRCLLLVCSPSCRQESL